MYSSPGSNSGKSTVNNPQLLPPRKRHNFVTPEDDISVQSTPHTSHQSSPTPKDDNKDIITGQSSSTPEENVESDSASKTIFAWQKLYEINILKGVLEHYKENGVYPFDNSSEMRKFYLSWIEKHGVHVDEDAFYDKLVDLPDRFFLNRQIVSFTSLANHIMEDWMDPLEVEIYQLSYKIWGPTRDDVNQDEGDEGKDLSSKVNQGGSSSF